MRGGEIISAAHPLGVRRCSTLNDDEFDIPPLDLTTPSLSIPLPPNMVNNSNKVDIVSSSGAKDVGIPPLHVTDQLSMGGRAGGSFFEWWH